MPLALPMSRVVEDDDVIEYAQEKRAPYRSKALSEDIYPSEDGERDRTVGSVTLRAGILHTQ